MSINYKTYILKNEHFYEHFGLRNSVSFWPQMESKGLPTQQGWCLQLLPVYPHIAAVPLPTHTAVFAGALK